MQDEIDKHEPAGAWRSLGIMPRITDTVALFGGLLMVAMAIMVVFSVGLRASGYAPVNGDYEYVKMGMAISVFSFLPRTQMRRGNIVADTFTAWLPARIRHALDAFLDRLYGVVMAAICCCLGLGAWETFKSGETTMQTQLPLWPAIAICTALCLLLAAAAFSSARQVRLVPGQDPNGGDGS